MLRFHSRRRAGFECGATGAKLVVLDRRDGVERVEHVFIEEVLFEARVKGAAGTPMELARHLLLHKYLSGCRTVFTAPGATESCFVILPKMDRAEAESAMLLQARKLVSWETENPVFSSAGSGFLRDRAGHLVGLADWRAVKAWGRLFEASGGLVDDVTVEACAYQALACRQRWADEFPIVLVVDIGATTTRFYVLDRQSVRFMRKVLVGGDAVTNTLTTAISTDAGPIEFTDIEAEAVKIAGALPEAGRKQKPKVATTRPSGEREGAQESGTEHDGTRSEPHLIQQLDVLARPVSERMAAEITRSIQFFKDNVGQKVDAVFLTGGAVQSASLRSHLEKSLELPVRVIDPFAGLSFANEGTRSYAGKNAARLAVAAGLALSGRPEISLMPGHVHVMKRVSSFMPVAVAALLILCFLPLIGLGIDRTIRIRSARQDMERYQLQVRHVMEETARLTELRNRSTELASTIRALEDVIGRHPLWPGVMNAISEAVPDDIILLSCGVGVDPRNPNSVLLHGKVLRSAARFDDAMSSLLSALGSSVFFRRVNIISAESAPSETELGTFDIQCELVY